MMPDTDVMICGAGSAGLYLALRLHQRGFRVMVIEQKSGPVLHSRSIGIHPPGIALLQEAGVLETVRKAAVSVTGGLAFDREHPLGNMHFSTDEHPREILAVPQYVTEQQFEQALPDGCIRRGITFLASSQNDQIITASTSAGDITARYLVGADGLHSAVRQTNEMGWAGRDYPPEFAMGDFADNTIFGDKAVIFLTPDGMIESFPLAGGVRRWVMQAAHETVPDAGSLCHRVQQRIGQGAEAHTNTLFSRFKTSGYLAGSFVKGRVLLIGDAAHVCSPIGGQGMNLGWINARRLEDVLVRCLQGPLTPAEEKSLFQNWQTDARRRAAEVIRRAEFNMRLGGATRFHGLRCLMVRFLLASPLRGPLSRRFTMQGL